MNYEGIREWAEKTNTTVEYAICIESVGTKEELHFHVSKVHKNNTAAFAMEV